MSRQWRELVGAAVLAVVLTTTSAATAAAKPVALDDAALAAAALTTADFPPGWQPVPDGFVAQVTQPDPTGGWCGKGNGAALAVANGAVGRVFVAFGPDPSISGVVYEHLVSFPTAAAARAFAHQDPACTQWVGTDGWSYTLQLRSGPRIGGPTTRVQVSGAPASGTGQLDEVVAIIRQGNHVLAVGEDRYDGTTASARDMEHYAALASQRLHDAVKAARRAR